MLRLDASPKPFRYSLNDKIRTLTTRMLGVVTSRAQEKILDLGKERIERILLVRATFRLGDSVLATPAIFLFRKNFPNARIDFVGAPVAQPLYRNLPIDHLFTLSGRFPNAYIKVLRQIQTVRYDLAVDVSASKSAMASFIVGFSGARYRVGCRGRRDRWFNVRIDRPGEKNKYRVLPLYLEALGLKTEETLPAMILSEAEKAEGRARIAGLFEPNAGPVVGIFVGARKILGKRWPVAHFLQLIRSLSQHGIKIIVFLGPEEKSLRQTYMRELGSTIPLVTVPSVRLYASMIANCSLFITCDSGPMHLSCAVGTRTVALFQQPNVARWAPPEGLCRVLYEPGGVHVEDVFKVTLEELACRSHQRESEATPGDKKSSTAQLVVTPKQPQSYPELGH